MTKLCSPRLSLLGAAWLLGACAVAAQTPPPVLPAGQSLLPSDLRVFKPYGLSPDAARAEIVPVEGQAFKEAWRLTAVKPAARFYDVGVVAKIKSPLRKGDVLWISFWTRRIESRAESGEAMADVALEQPVGAGRERPLERGLSFGPAWTQTSLPFVLAHDAEPDQAAVSLRFGHAVQTLEFGGVTLLDCGPDAVLADLPKTVTRYDGYAPDAPWRQAAAARIENYRKGDLLVKVTDTRGNPVPGAEVQVRMRRHAFGWGTEINAAVLMNDRDPDSARYREVIEKYFNKVVFGNALKWGRWATNNEESAQVARALPWLRERDIAVRGHVLVWPSWKHLPPFMPGLKDNPPALRKAVADHIGVETKAYRGQLAEWDVLNETFAHHDLMDILGRGVMADWFRAAHAGDPNAKLFYNDFTMFHGSGPGSASQYFYDTVKFLQDQGAPVEAIGEQGHFGGSPAGPPTLLAALDHFAELGLPIQISEFDIDGTDAGLQADYMRDFMTAVFSHPAVIGVVQWGFWEKAHWKPNAALWDAQWHLRPHGQVWVDLVTKAWWTNADGHTGPDGAFSLRGFKGEYDVTVTRGGAALQQKAVIGAEPAKLEVNIGDLRPGGTPPLPPTGGR